MPSSIARAVSRTLNGAGRGLTRRFHGPTVSLAGRFHPIVSWLSPRRPFVRRVSGDGFEIYVSLLDLSVSYGLLTTGAWEPLTTTAVKRTLRPGMLVLDIGAQLGYYTLLARTLVGPTGRVTAFEPEARHLALLRRSVATNGFRNVQIVPKAVSSETGVLRIAVNSWTPPREMEAIRLDDFWKGPPRPVDFIKMDIDGGELSALEGMQETLAASPSLRMLVEYDPWQHQVSGGRPSDLLDALAGLGFSVDLLIDEAAGVCGPADWETVARQQTSVNLLLSRRKAF